VILNGQAYQAGWQRDDDGDIQVMVNGGLFILSLPE
jgi:hypothetical protein